MSHSLYDVTDFEIVGPYTLRVTFDDGSVQLVNLEPVLYGEVFGPLRDLEFFCQMKLDPETKTLVWPNGADFDPYVLHEWPRVVDELSRRLQASVLPA
jgi:Protein of unknown function (DUF2442)